MKKPWERRLDDLAQIIRNCSVTYFQPNLFRQNVNQFLQTSRTITFILQKNKNDIPEFNNWYTTNVKDKWSQDKVMTWAKNARNKIEKQGDLEINSTLELALISSYLSEDDIEIQCGPEELLNGDVKRLIKHARQKIPKSFHAATGLKIERNWICAELDEYELLHALSYVYARVYECCDRVAQLIGSRMPESIAEPSTIANKCVIDRYIQLVKLSDKKTYYTNSVSRVYRREDMIDTKLKNEMDSVVQACDTPTDFGSAVQLHENMAIRIFEKNGYHQNTLFFLKKDWSPMYFCATVFADRIDKYYFWRMMGDHAHVEQPHGVVFVGEIWDRDSSAVALGSAIDDMPIRGEALNLISFDRDANICQTRWKINRNIFGEPRLETAERLMKLSELGMLVPVMRGMGVDPDNFT